MPGAAAVESQVQSTLPPMPPPLATTALFWSRTITVQATRSESLAVKCTGPPLVPVTAGAYSFGRPVCPTAARIDGSFAYRLCPGHVVGYVSRCPEIVRNGTARPAG